MESPAIAKRNKILCGSGLLQKQLAKRTEKFIKDSKKKKKKIQESVQRLSFL